MERRASSALGAPYTPDYLATFHGNRSRVAVTAGDRVEIEKRGCSAGGTDGVQGINALNAAGVTGDRHSTLEITLGQFRLLRFDRLNGNCSCTRLSRERYTFERRI